jgi:hypothetical protein
MIVNLANDLLHNTDFNADTVHPWYAEKIQPPTLRDESIPIKAAKPTHILPPTRPYLHCDINVENIIGLTIAQLGASKRLITAIVTAVNVFCRPCVQAEQVPRSAPLCEGKTLIEEAPSERFIVLGWFIDLWELLLILPEDKHFAWTHNIHNVLAADTISKQQLKTLVGLLGHAAQGIPMSQYFLKWYYRRIAAYKSPFQKQVLTK